MAMICKTCASECEGCMDCHDIPSGGPCSGCGVWLDRDYIMWDSVCDDCAAKLELYAGDEPA